MKPRHLCWLCTVALQAAAPQAPPEVTSREAPATFTSRVNLVSVPVVVRDSKGRAVGTLRQEDFRLFDKGKPQTIVKFSIRRNAISGREAAPANPATSAAPAAATATPEATAPGLPENYVAYVFDDIHTNFADLARTRAAAKQHLASLAPSSRAAIATTSGRVFQDFTADRDKLNEALDRIAPGPSAAPPSGATQELSQHDVCPPQHQPLSC